MFISTTSAAPGFGARTGRGGLRIALQILIYGRIGIGAARVGMAQAAFDRTVYHLKSRHAFGASLASKQHWQFVMADYAADLECAPCISKRHCGSTSASGSPNPRRRWRNCGARIWPRGSPGMPCRPSVDSALCGRSAPTAQGARWRPSTVTARSARFRKAPTKSSGGCWRVRSSGAHTG
ncbi:hypothetical protein CBI38_22845 [Rhodococcus oxybenzonivorans]|uniref:Acyl-CoA dehydrogenase/oxidase C-terminal domain-containing protein n=1 Tax=Rhodococcus oxybenzonivorans TaxID=1990687 RepID=A0A2S2BZH7_9NOCA|nr:hypothetical protein CBI38_22845 [Rhodococcus oxybenzonivorans]